MNTEYINIGLDIIVLMGLGIFFFFALKLSAALNAFRAHRDEFGQTMEQLDQSIKGAKESLLNIKQSSQDANQDLEALVEEAKTLIDDLQVVNGVGDGLAKRLETLIERNRQNAPVAQGSLGGNVSSLATARAGRGAEKDTGFVIHDPDFEAGGRRDEDIFDENDLEALDADPEMSHLSSKAEKELYKALKNKRIQ